MLQATKRLCQLHIYAYRALLLIVLIAIISISQFAQFAAILFCVFAVTGFVIELSTPPARPMDRGLSLKFVIFSLTARYIWNAFQLAEPGK